MGQQYRLDNLPLNEQGIDQLLVRVDILPPELVLSQAATESGWGTSRMARKLNNFFGHYCFEKRMWCFAVSPEWLRRGQVV